MHRRLLQLGVVLSVLVAVAASSAAAGAARGVAGCAAEAGKSVAVTKSYRVTLHVGMPEQMYTPAQVKAMHPKHGEVMLRGSMGGMSMGGSMRHLEVQICSRAGAVIANAMPTITLSDSTSMAMTMKVPVAVMQGVGAGIADLHYGNNVQMTAGHAFTVKVQVERETVVFRLRLPKK